MSPSANEAVVRAFLVALGPDLDGVRTAIERYLTPDVVYSNPGLPPCVGRAAVADLYEEFARIAGFARVLIEMLAVLSDGGLVMTERIDSALTSSGELIGGESTPAMGIFEVRDGLISAWRDYYDPTPLLAHFASLG
jgi:limonene-1,2-epoxide hydrolase